MKYGYMHRLKHGPESALLSDVKGSYILFVVCDDSPYGILGKVFAIGFSFFNLAHRETLVVTCICLNKEEIN